MQRRGRRRPAPPRGPLGVVKRALQSDGQLVARVGAALAGTATTGAIAAVGIALMAQLFHYLLYRVLGGALLAGLVGLALVAWAIADRRRLDRARRARQRLAVGLGLIGLGVIAATVRFAERTTIEAVALGTLLALASAVTGVGASIVVEWNVSRAATERRRGFYAQLRASRLARRMLGAADYRVLRRKGALPVESTLYPGRVYLVPLRTTPAGARILVLEQGRPAGGLCLRPREPLPDPEEALAHILAIRSDERAWLERANFFPQDRELTPQALGLAAGRPGNYDR